MIKISKNTKVFAYCPSNVVTGGAELLHQLISTLNNKNIDAYIIYYDNCNSEIPSEYNKYNIKTAISIEDAPENVVVFFEGVFEKTMQITKSQIILWWLSVDNFYHASRKHLSLIDYFKWDFKYGFWVVARRLGHLILKKENYFRKNFSIKYLKNLNALNCYQSEYAQFFLNNQGFKETFPLSDYINNEFIESENKNTKERKILYNPKKGIEFTQKIIKLIENEKWIPLEKMSRNEMKNALKTSMLYIDFGFHPGKDRIPREACISDCCIITGRKGSANHFEDVSINNFYKIDERNTKLYEIKNKILDILDNYDNHIKEFGFYKKRILVEKEKFEDEVKIIFNII